MENTNNDIIDIGKHRRNTVIEILKKLQEHDRVCCVRYTGYGKTYYIIKQLIDMFPNKQFLIFVPAKSLIKRYKQLFLNSNVIIKTYQSLLFMKDNEIEDSFSNIDYIICDEAHRLGKNKWRQSIKNAFDIINSGNTKIVGLTATPKRGDKIDIVEDFFNGIETSRFDLLDGIQAGYIPKIDYVVAYCDLSGLDKEIYDERMEDIDRYEIDKLLNVSNIIKENITEDKLKENLKVVLYVSRLKDIDTAKESCNKWFTEAFPNKNIKVFSLSSEYTDKENNDYLDEYSDDEDNSSIDIMVSCNKLNEGLHLPKCSIAILLRKTASPIVYFQQIGRAINDSKPVIFDLIDNSTHIRQVENDFEQGNQENLDLSIPSNKSKKIFSECINLISKTKDIEDILNKFKIQHIKISDEEIEDICNLYKEGYFLEDIESKVHRSYRTIIQILQEHNLYKSVSDKREGLIETINNYYKKGYSHVQIADILNMTPPSIWYYLNRYCKDYVNRSKLDKSEQIYEYYKDGCSIKEIRHKVHMRDIKIREILKDKYNIDVADINKKNLIQRNAKIIAMYKNNIAVSQIANTFGLADHTVRNILVDKGLIPTKKEKLIRKEREICELYRKGYNISQIVKIVHSCNKTICDVLNNNNIRDIHNKNSIEKEQEIERKVCKMYKENYTVTQIKLKVHISDWKMYKILEKNNIKKRRSK